MKFNLLTLFLFLSTFSFAQLTKMEVFSVGTKLAFYPEQCGNSIPEAADKLSFCDKNNTLGVVENSYGLNARGVKRMLPNHFNADEIYLTNNGLSIRNTDGTWENIPNIAMPNPFSTQPIIQSGVMTSSGKILLQTSVNTYQFEEYDRSTKKFKTVKMPTNYYVRGLVYDKDRDLTWILGQKGFEISLFAYNGNTVVAVADLAETNLKNIFSENMIYREDNIYLGGNDGFFKLDLSNYSSSVPVTQYSSTTTPSIPINKIYDMEFDKNGFLWLTVGALNNFGIIKFNLTDGTHQYYQFPEQESPIIYYKILDIAIDNEGVIWASAQNYSGLLKITFSGNTPTLTAYTKAEIVALGVPYIYPPNNVYFKNDQFYFTTEDYSSSSNEWNEVLINHNGTWFGRNDNEPGNLSASMQSRFTACLPDETGGVWWFNLYDDLVLHRGADDHHDYLNIKNGYTQVIDADNNPIINGGDPIKLRKINFPNTHLIEQSEDTPTKLQRVDNQIWAFNNMKKKIEVFENENLVTTYNLEDDLFKNIHYFAVDEAHNAWFMRYYNDLKIRKYNPITKELTTYEPEPYIGPLDKIVAAPDNAVWFVGNKGMLYFKDDNWYNFTNADYPEFFNVVDLVVDKNGKAYVLTNDNAGIVTIENPTTTPIIKKTIIEGYYSVLPKLKHYRPGCLAIDSEGSVWTHASYNTFKLIDDDFTAQYTLKTPVAISNLKPNFNVQLAPNPAHDYVEVLTDKRVDRIEVYSALGQKVYTAKKSTKIDLQKLQKGIYFVQVTHNEYFVTRKLVIE